VFSTELNKPLKVKEDPKPISSNGQRSTWKLRKWTKDRGYVTVKQAKSDTDSIPENTQNGNETSKIHKSTKVNIISIQSCNYYEPG